MGSLARSAIGPALILLASIASFPGCSGPESGDADGPATGGDGQRVTNVVVETIRPGTLEEYIDLTGTTEALDDVVIAAELGGTVLEFPVDRGDRVEKGRVLARVSSDIYEAQLEEARARLALKKAAYEKAHSLFERGSITAMQELAARVDSDAARAQAAEAESRLRRAVVRAPFAGIVDRRYVDPGELVPPGGRLLRLVDRSGMRIRASLSEIDASSLKRGAAARITFDAFPGRSFDAVLTFVAATSDPESGSFPCEFRLTGDSDGIVRGGMIARIRVLKQTHADVLVLPRTAIVESETGSAVFVLDGDTAHRRRVVLGASNGGRVIVREGLEPGREIVITGQRDLVDGQAVRVTGGRSGDGG